MNNPTNIMNIPWISQFSSVDDPISLLSSSHVPRLSWSQWARTCPIAPAQAVDLRYDGNTLFLQRNSGIKFQQKLGFHRNLSKFDFIEFYPNLSEFIQISFNGISPTNVQ